MGNGLTRRQKDYVAVASDPAIRTIADVGKQLGTTRQAAHACLTRVDVAKEVERRRTAKLDKARGTLGAFTAEIRRFLKHVQRIDPASCSHAELIGIMDGMAKIREKELTFEQNTDPDKRKEAEQHLGEAHRLRDLERWGRIAANVGAPTAERLASIANRLLKRSESRLGESKMLEKERNSANVR